MTSLSTLAQFLRTQDDVGALQARLDRLHEQIATHKKTTTYGGLGTQARMAIDARGKLGEIEAYQRNIEVAQLRASTAITAMQRIGDIAGRLVTELMRPEPITAKDVQLLNEMGANAFRQLASILNTRADGRYVFAGADVDTAPVESAAAEAFFEAIGTEAGNYGLGASAVLKATRDLASQASPFSPSLDNPGLETVKARIDQGVDISYGVKANGLPSSAIQDDPAPLPFFREFLRGFAVLAQVPAPQEASKAEFGHLLSSLRSKLQEAVTALNQQTSRIGASAQELEATSRKHAEVRLLFTKVVQDIEDVDMAAAISELNQTQAQLQASYRATAIVARLSLNDFL